MKTEDIDQMLRTVRDYERTSFGIKFGSDFPALAELLSTSEEFRGMCQGQTAMAALMIVTATNKESIERIIEHSPLRDGLLLVFYAAYKLGQQQAEIEKLESLHQVEKS